MEYNRYPLVEIDDKDALTVKDTTGNSMIHLVEYDGYFVALHLVENGLLADIRTNIPSIINMEVRPDDVFLMAYPKAGTHWTNEIIHMLLKGKAEYQKVTKVEYMLPFQTPDVIDNIPSPRVLNSHMMFRHLPKDILRKKNKIVFVHRHPKDIALSFYHHCSQTVIQLKGSWNDFLHFFMSTRVMYNSPWYQYILDWERCIKEHSELDVLYVGYEDLTKDPVKEIERIAVFLEVKSGKDFYTNIAERCNFEQLKHSYKERESSEPNDFRKVCKSLHQHLKHSPTLHTALTLRTVCLVI